MQVVILAGGVASRLRELSQKAPKALLPVCGRPFLSHQLELLARSGMDEAVICVGHLGDQIESFVAGWKEAPLKVRFSKDGDRLLGTGGAVWRALPLLRENFIVIYGDSYLPMNYRAAFVAHSKAGRSATMAVLKNRNRWDKSNIRVDGNRVVLYDKETTDPSVDFIDAGLTIYRRSVWESQVLETPFDLSAILKKLVELRELTAFPIQERFYEVGSFSGLSEFQKIIEERGRKKSL